MRRLAYVVMPICAVVLLVAPMVGAAGSADVKQEVMVRMREYSAALTKHDLAALEKIWADDYTFTNGRGQFLTKKERLDNIRTGATQFDSIGRDDETIHVFGDTAVVTSRVQLKVIYSGKESSGPYRSINVWAKMQGRWQLVANQITPIEQ